METDPLMVVPLSALSAAATYLATRPWGEVNELIYTLNQATPLPVDPPTSEEAPDA